MSPVDKQHTVDIIEIFNNNVWNVDCCHELPKVAGMKVPDLPSLQPCIFLAMEFPEYVKRGVVDGSTLALGIVEQDVSLIKSKRGKATDGLSIFQQLPEGVKGIDSIGH